MYIIAFVMGAEPLPLSLVIIALVLALIGAAIAVRDSVAVPRPRVSDVAAGAAATAFSLLLCREMGIPALVTVSITAIVIGMMTAPRGPLDDRAEGSAYVGAFVGLLAPTITVPSGWVIVAGAVAGLLWSLIGLYVMPGVGGRLGLVAFMGSSAIYWLATALGYDHGKVLLPEVQGMAHMAMIPIGGVAAVLTWMLIQRRGWDFALASGVTSLAVCGGIHMADMGALEPVLATAWFGGTMVGLSTPARLPNAGWVTLAGLMYGAYMLHFAGPLTGHVGVIGATGTIAVFVAMGALRVGTWVMPRLRGEVGRRGKQAPA
jgi:hypothetical protein